MSDMTPDNQSRTPEEQRAYQARQRQRATIMGGLLFFLVILFYLITIVKIGASVQ